jgi:hypothetical protein
MDKFRDKAKDLYTWELPYKSSLESRQDGDFDTVRQIFDDGATPQSSRNDYTVSEGKPNIPERLAGSFSKKLKILAEAIEELNQEVKKRIKMSYLFQTKIDAEILRLEFLLRELDHWTLGCEESIEHRRLGLEREILNLRREKRSERLRAWEDIDSLIRRRRELIMEYQI